MNDTLHDTAEPLPEGRFAGRRDFVDLIRRALAMAARAGWTPLVLSDPDFADWPLGEREVIDAFNDWAGQGGQLRLLARRYDTLRLQHPRFVQWRSTWSHRVEAHAWPAAPQGDLPSALWTPHWTLERLDVAHCTGVASHAPARRVALRERIDSAWARGGPSFPASTLGL